MSCDRPSLTAESMAHPLVPKGPASAYAQEIECDEPNTRHWVHRWCFDKNQGKTATHPPVLGPDEECTIPMCMNKAATLYAKSNFMGRRKVTEEKTKTTDKGKKFTFLKKGPYVYSTYETVYQDELALAKGLLELPGIREAKAEQKAAGDGSWMNKPENVTVALLAETSAEWHISAQAAMLAGLTVTTVYATLGAEAMLHGLNETQAEIIVVDWLQYKSLAKDVLRKCPHLKYCVLIGSDAVPEKVDGVANPDPMPTDDTWEWADKPPCTDGEADVPVYTFSGLVKKGKGAKFEDFKDDMPKASDVALIMYTSGSTGLPKGVLLTHSNFVCVIASAIAQGVVAPTVDDVYLAYLPLAHILELVCEVANCCSGATIGYGSPHTLVGSSKMVEAGDMETPDLTALRPTLMAAVPAVLELIANGLKNKIGTSGPVADLFWGMITRKLAGKSGGVPEGAPGCMGCCSCLDGLIANKVKAGAGLDRCRLLISGGAPLSAETQNFCAAALAPVAQGYGATETVGCATVQESVYGQDPPNHGRPIDVKTGHVGAIQPATELKLVSVPEMGYYTEGTADKDGNMRIAGEILVAGGNVSQGYYMLPEKTAKDFIKHDDGKTWFHTGDIGVMLDNGTLKIVDRKKDLIKLSGGEYVSLGKVEATLKGVSGIMACIVFAKSDMNYCVCVVSQPEKGWAAVNGRPDEKQLLEDIKAHLKKQKLVTFEIPTKVKIDDTIWTAENGLTTASLKIQRGPLRDYYMGGNDGKGNAGPELLAEMDYEFPTN